MWSFDIFCINSMLDVRVQDKAMLDGFKSRESRGMSSK